MRKILYIVAGLTLVTSAAYAATSQVDIVQKGDYIYITANGIANHETGEFPRRGNPHAIKEQRWNYRVTANPLKSGKITPMVRQPFGVALNGVTFDPGTAHCYGVEKGQRPSTICDWSGEAMIEGRRILGLDSSHAHVQPNGAYHYHGVPTKMPEIANGTSPLTHIGYAADGFKIYNDMSGKYTSSYALKSGIRPSGPGGTYDGTYTEDYSYVAGSGTLDNCNGTEINGEYGYVVTKSFPYVPRCWVGTPDESFRSKGRRAGGKSGGRGRHRHSRR